MTRFTLPDRYRLEGALAGGGMATVYAAHDTLLDRRVAVKVLAEHLNADTAARQRFQREARAAASVSSHPAVVTIFDVGEHEGRSFMVMELRRGGTVADVVRRSGAVEPQRALAWLRDVADALDTAHAAGIVHRDVKPANLLLDEHDRVAVADFGIARLAWEDQVTATGQILGTAAYIAPEQAEGQAATPASDRYALAVVAFELLTGARPFQAEHFAAQARAHIEDPVPAASARAPSLPPAVDAVLQRGMAKGPAERWDTAAQFVGALEAALADVPRTETTRVMAARAPAAGAAPPPARAPLAPAPRRRGLAVAAVPLLLAIVAVALAAALLSGGGDNDQEEPTSRAARTPTAEATPTPDAERTPEPTATPAQQPDGGGPAALNARGFELFQRGDYAAAVPILRNAVEACGDSGALDPCGFALYNLAASLRRSGEPEAAIPVLEDRLNRFGDNDAGDVQRELDAAYADAGLDQPGNGNGNGKGKAKGKKKDSDED